MLPALVGGALIGLAATLLWFGNGRIAGVSGILHGALLPADGRRGERLVFLLGLALAGLAVGSGFGLGTRAAAPVPVVLVAGFLVGFGARLGGGCTSGHGVCGLARGSTRSLVAVLTFMATGALTVFVVTRFFPALEVVP